LLTRIEKELLKNLKLDPEVEELAKNPTITGDFNTIGLIQRKVGTPSEDINFWKIWRVSKNKEKL